MSSRVSNPPPERLLVIDGDCPFCRRWARRLNRWTGVRYAAYQEVEGRFPEIPRQAFERAVQLLEPDGRVLAGAGAVFGCVRDQRGGGWLFRLYQRSGLFAWVAERLYGLVSRNRHRLG